MKDAKTVSKKLLERLAMTTRTSADTSCEKKKGDRLRLSPLTAPCVKSIGKTNINCSIEAGGNDFVQGGIHE